MDDSRLGFGISHLLEGIILQLCPLLLVLDVLDEPLHALLGLCNIRKDELEVDDIHVTNGVDAAIDVDDVVVLEAPHDVALWSRVDGQGQGCMSSTSENSTTQHSGLGFGVWGLGFGVWGLGFGVRGATLSSKHVMT